MLLNNLYTIRNLEVKPGNAGIIADIELNSGHPVFKGHFPDNPVLPGVCTIQIIKELLEKSFHKTLIMTKASNIKYLGLVNPEKMPVLNFILQLDQAVNDSLTCTARITAGNMLVCSFKGEFGNYYP